jgi:hypothetical protein
MDDIASGELQQLIGVNKVALNVFRAEVAR